MRILMIAPEPFFQPRGTPFSVLHRIRALTRLGHTVDLVTYPMGESPAVPGLVYHRAARVPLVRDVPAGPSVAKVLLDAPLFLRARRLAAGGRYDLIHTHEEAGAMGAYLARRYRVRHLYDMHSSLPQQFENFARFNWRPVVALFRGIERYTLDGADGVIAICQDLYDRVKGSGYRGAVALIENTLDVQIPDMREEEIAALRRTLSIDGAAIVYTGTLEAYQGLDLLIDAIPRVTAVHPRARFLIVGGASNQIEGLRSRAEARGAAGSVAFVPAVPPERVFLYHRLADVLVTTRAKGTNTPLKVYQYLRAGRPIVATAIRSHTQVLDTATAELVAPDPGAIAAGLIRLLSDPARAAAIAAAAGERARERYGEEVYMQRLQNLLEEIPARGPREAAEAGSSR